MDGGGEEAGVEGSLCGGKAGVDVGGRVEG